MKFTSPKSKSKTGIVLHAEEGPKTMDDDMRRWFENNAVIHNIMSIFVGTETSTRYLAQKFAETFPGKCMLCNFHKYSVMHGHEEPGSEPPDHPCIEKAIVIDTNDVKEV